jgi:hypothetical protein
MVVFDIVFYPSDITKVLLSSHRLLQTNHYSMPNLLTYQVSANVIPLYKKGDKANVHNYHPVSLLCCVSKILERIVFKHVYNHIRDNNLLSPNQSGFQTGDSTCNQLSFLYHTFCQALEIGRAHV